MRLLVLITFQSWEWVLQIGIDMSYFHVVSQGHAQMDLSLIVQVSMAHLPDYMAGPLATAHESVKTHTEGHLLFIVQFFHRSKENSMQFSTELICPSPRVFPPVNCSELTFPPGCWWAAGPQSCRL